MLPSEKNNLVYLLNILEHIGKIWKYTADAKDAEGLYELNEQLNLNASLTLLANIVKNLILRGRASAYKFIIPYGIRRYDFICAGPVLRG
jgi:uncharacterized protein with HEPN domain